VSLEVERRDVKFDDATEVEGRRRESSDSSVEGEGDDSFELESLDPIPCEERRDA